MLPLTTWAQLVEFPVQRKPNTGSTSSAARIKTVTPVSLPFWDDFSFTTDDYPVDSLWVNNRKVLVNSGQGITPPTINVATFDGLNENGQPYNPTDGLDYGYRDTLESQPILMAVVPELLRNNVFLSFYYQWGGNGEPPDQNDFLRLEFKNENEEWEEVMIMRVRPDQNPDQFYDTLIRINQDRFYHDEFRFRFISFGRRSGRYDAWHIDYVYLNKERNENDDSYPDRSLSTSPSTIFGKYYTVPLTHFFNQPTINTTSFYVRNLFDSITVLTYNTDLQAKKIYNNTSVTNSINLDFEKPLVGNDGTTQPKELKEVFIATLPDAGNTSIFDPAAKAIELTMTLTLNSADNKPLSDPNSDYDINYEPIDFRWNDTLSVKYFLDSVYAYDDGTAEYGGGTANSGNILAYRFDMQTSLQDTINGISIHFPYFSGLAASTIDFFIFMDEGGTPGNLVYEQSIDVVQKGNNEFHFTPLYEGVLVQNAFFIGYRKNPPDEARAWIGIDKSNNTGDRMFYKSTESSSTWILNDDITGSLMMRPHFGTADVVTSRQEELQPVFLYPNPNQGTFYLKGTVDHIEIMTLTGQPVHFQTENFVEEKRIEVSASPGVYIVRYKSGARIFTRKIIITR